VLSLPPIPFDLLVSHSAQQRRHALLLNFLCAKFDVTVARRRQRSAQSACCSCFRVHLYLAEDDGDKHACRVLQTVQRIVAMDASLITAVDADGDTPLHNAARGGHAQIVEYLLQQGASASTLNNAQHTPRGTCGGDISADLVVLLRHAEEAGVPPNLAMEA
jgi:Ankyrin repeats (3 copies)